MKIAMADEELTAQDLQDLFEDEYERIINDAQNKD